MIRSSGFGMFSPSQSIIDIRSEIDRLSLQLSTGKKSQTITGFGGQLARSIDLHSRLKKFDVFSDSISTSGGALDSILNVINTFSKTTEQIQTNILSSTTVPNAAGRNSLKDTLKSQFYSLTNYLNTDFNGSYLFGGRNVGAPPVANGKDILFGVEGKAGLKQYLEERVKANCGQDNLGRLKIVNSGGNITLSETIVPQNFGYKIKSVSSSDSSIGVSDTPTADIVPVGAKSKTLSVGTVTASTILTITLELPDGTTTDIKLSPTAATGITTFSIGSSADATAQNISAALTNQIKYHSQVELTGAVSQQASLEYFKGSSSHPPRRVKGATPEVATEYETDPSIIAASTLIWYTGTDDDSDPRMDKSSQVTDHIITGTGARANETGFVETLAYTALMALGNFNDADQTMAADQFSDLRDRTRKGLGTANEDLNEMKASVGSARASIKSANDDMVAQKNIMESILSDIENASPEKTAILLSNMQTSLQVMYQVTAKLSSLSLANYL